MASTHIDFIIEGYYKDAYEETLKEHGLVDDDTARSIIFKVLELKQGGKKHLPALMQALATHVDPVLQHRYHSLANKYFMRAARNKLRKPILMPKLRQSTALTCPAVSSDTTNWEEIFQLCRAEQYERMVEAGEDRLSPEWTPDDEAA